MRRASIETIERMVKDVTVSQAEATRSVCLSTRGFSFKLTRFRLLSPVPSSLRPLSLCQQFLFAQLLSAHARTAGRMGPPPHISTLASGRSNFCHKWWFLWYEILLSLKIQLRNKICAKFVPPKLKVRTVHFNYRPLPHCESVLLKSI